MLGSSNSLSAGIVYSHFKTPLSRLLDLAEYLLDDLAKKKMGRGAVAMSHLSRNGLKSEFALNWGKPGEPVSAHRRMGKIIKAFYMGNISSRLSYKLREIMPFADAAIHNININDKMDDQEKEKKREQLLSGFLQAAMDTPLKSEELEKHILDLWLEGIRQHPKEPERAVEGLLLAKAMSSFAGGEK